MTEKLAFPDSASDSSDSRRQFLQGAGAVAAKTDLKPFDAAQAIVVKSR